MSEAITVRDVIEQELRHGGVSDLNTEIRAKIDEVVLNRLGVESLDQNMDGMDWFVVRFGVMQGIGQVLDWKNHHSDKYERHYIDGRDLFGDHGSHGGSGERRYYDMRDLFDHSHDED